MNKYVCNNCKDEIDEFNENEYYGLNYKVYCSTGCFKDEYESAENKQTSSAKVADNNKTNKSNKRQKQIYKKKSKQKKGKRK